MRNRTVGSKVTEAEYERLSALAEQEGQRLGEWTRAALLERIEGRKPSAIEEALHKYDIWGNLLEKQVTKGDDVPMLSVAVNTKNQISGYCYDAAGNLLHQGACPGSTYTYEAENRLVSAAGVTYEYDGDGRRVKKSSGTLYWYGADGALLFETDLSGTVVQGKSVFFHGRRIVRRADEKPYYYIGDHLGSRRLLLGPTGGNYHESDYYPYGGERVIVNTADSPHKFTGQERDSESGLDYFIARHYSSNLGRFLQPDPDNAGALEDDPQSWNGYAYARNNPLLFTDPTGEAFGVCGTSPPGNPAVPAECVTFEKDEDFFELRQTLEAAGVRFEENGNIVTASGNVLGTFRQLSPGCSIDLACHFFVGFGDAVFNENPRGLARLGGAVAVGAVLQLPAIMRSGTGLIALGAADEAAEISTLVGRAASTVGNQTATASSRAQALAAAEQWVGLGARPIYKAGEIIGKISADGTRVYRITSINKAQPYVNLVNRTTGGNLHVRF